MENRKILLMKSWMIRAAVMKRDAYLPENSGELADYLMAMAVALERCAGELAIAIELDGE